MNGRIKNITFVVLLVLMALPALQYRFGMFKTRPLNGDFVLHEKPSFTHESWMNGTFQSEFENYLNDHIGFRNFFVRLNNQIDFSFFRKANAEGVVVGKDGMPFEFDYIRAYNGNDFIGLKTIEKKINRLKFLQDFLKEKFDIDLIFMLEPSKVRFYPEYIPDRYQQSQNTTSNYEVIRKYLDELGVRYLDLNSYFKQLKGTKPWPLYPKYGIHWSEYSMTIVADTLINYMEKLRNIAMPHYKVEKIVSGDTLSPSDYDIGKTMNLLWTLPQPQLAYPVFTFPDTSGTRPMVLSVSDSYYWNFFNTRIPKHLFANEAFWYFNAKVYPDFYFGEKWVDQLDLKTEIEKQDIILLGITDRFLYKLAWDFIDNVYALYTPRFTGDIIYKYENLIRKDAQWFDRILEEAGRKNISPADAIAAEARYEAFREEQETFLVWYGTEHYREVIENDEAWKKTVIEKAARNNLAFEEQLTLDAEYVFQSEHPGAYKKYRLIKTFEKQIRADSVWLHKVEEKAGYYRTDTETMIKIDAEYMADSEINKADPFEAKTKIYENLIRNDPQWLDNVRKKAEARGKTLEEMIRADAKYMARQDEKKK